MDKVNNELTVSEKSFDNCKTEVDPNLVYQARAELAHETLNTVNNIAGIVGDCMTAKERTKQVEAWSNAVINVTVEKFKTEHDHIEGTFRVQESKLSELSKGLDYAISIQNPELIAVAMRLISDVGTETSLKEEEKSNIDNDSSQPLLDF